MKKAITLLLVLCMLLSLTVSCAQPEKPDDTTAVSALPEETQMSEEKPVLPDEKFDGYEFRVLVTGNFQNNDFAVTEGAEDPVNNARYIWLSDLEEKFDLKLSQDEQIRFGSTTGNGPGYSAVQLINKTQEPTYDACMIGTYDVAKLALPGYLYDLNSLDYVDLSRSWWDQKANEDLTIQGKMFYTTGDISLTDNIVTHCILFNKELMRQTTSENLYDLVREGKWNFEKLSELVMLVSEDVNGDDRMDASDKYGLLTWNDSMLQILGAGRERICTVNKNGDIELSLYNDRTVSIYEKYTTLAYNGKYVINYQIEPNNPMSATPVATWDPTRDAIFNEGRALFYMSVFTAVARHRDSDVDFGILPFPLMTEEQKEYGHQVSAYHCQFLCVPYYIGNAKITGTVLEYLAYTGKKLMTPAYAEKTLVGTQFRDEESGDMLDVISASRVYDVGIYYGVPYRDQLIALFKNRTVALSALYERLKNSTQVLIDRINGSFAKLG